MQKLLTPHQSLNSGSAQLLMHLVLQPWHTARLGAGAPPTIHQPANGASTSPAEVANTGAALHRDCKRACWRLQQLTSLGWKRSQQLDLRSAGKLSADMASTATGEEPRCAATRTTVSIRLKHMLVELQALQQGDCMKPSARVPNTAGCFRSLASHLAKRLGQHLRSAQRSEVRAEASCLDGGCTPAISKQNG
jgi:hypothetical protein